MKNILSALTLCCFLSWCHSTSAQTSQAFENDICLPSTLYFLSGVQNDIFVEPLIKRWRPYNDVVRFSGTAKYVRRLERVASVTEPEDKSTVTVTLINQDDFDTVKSITSTVVLGKRGIGTEPVTVSIIGDSYTNGAFFRNALLDNGHVPNIQMIGLREVLGYQGPADQFDEGRGGWRLSTFFRVTKGRTQSYNGFWQPEGDAKYWGSTHFWILANEIRVNPDKEYTFDEKYFTGRFYKSSLLFDVKTGYKLKPGLNDIMYDNSLEQFVKYDGKRWRTVAYEDFNWSFNYGKYLSMWKLKAPMILAEFMGLNDFGSAPYKKNRDFTEWNALVEQVASSYLKAVPKGKFVMMIPSSTCGTLDNKDGSFTSRTHANIWDLRKNIIEKFDNRQSEGFYIVDSGIAIDNLYGFNFTRDTAFTKPYPEYSGEERIPIQAGICHPYANYPTLGYSLAAFIQAHRP